MPPGTDGDDEELVEIDVEIDGPPPLPDASAPELILDGGDTEPNRGVAAIESPPPAPEGPPPAPPDILEISDVVELQPPIVEAATDDPPAALALYEAEASAADGGGRRGALLLEVARLRELGAGGEEASNAALEPARAAFAADPASLPALWLLRRLLVRTGGWEELEAIYEQAIQASSSAADPRLRAELLLARGRLLEDRLARATDAVACYREALAAAPDHPGALLSLLLAGAQLRDSALCAEALGGLARRAETPAARAALVIEEGLAWRRAEPRDGADRALAVLEEELGRNDAGAPVGALLVELELLARADVPAATAARALEDLARRLSQVDTNLAVALLRERARLLRRELLAPEAALETLDEAARLDPTHPLVAAERFELALALDRRDAADEIARAFLVVAERDDEAVDFALVCAEAIFDPARPDAAVEILQMPRVQACRPARADLRALELALALVRRDPRALADAFTVGADSETHADTGSKVGALIAAGAVRAGALGQTDIAADLYRRAVDSAPSPAQAWPALQALVSLQAAGGRIEDAAAMLESAVAAPSSPRAGIAEGTDEAADAFEIWARESLVAIYADELGAPVRALPHQCRLVAMQPHGNAGRVRLCDLDLESGPDGLRPNERAENLLALAAGAIDPAVEIALRIMAGRALGDSAEPQQVAEGLALLGEAAAVDPSGLAAARLERAAASPAARAEIVAAELAFAVESGPAERTRALRFRLAHHRAAAGAFAEAMAALTPLRSEGDPLARAWSYELARRAGDAFLEVAVLSEETRAPDGTLGEEAGVLLAHGEALAEAGDPQGAADSLRRAVARAPDGETAADAALMLYRLATVAATSPGGSSAALPEALEALAGAVGDDPALAEAAVREAALSAVAAGSAVANGATTGSHLGDAPAAPAELTLLRFMTGVRAGDAKTVAESLTEIARGLADADGAVPAEATPLLARAAARARLGGAETAEAIAVAVWETAHPPALAPALADLPVAGAAPWPSGRPDPRRSRARRAGGALGVALHLEAALDAERKGELGAALAAYGSVIALDPDRLEAWTGVRRVARAGGDLLGEARALARVGVLVRDPRRAAALLAESASAYESAGRDDDAIAVLSRAVELCPDDTGAYARVHALLSRDLGGPGRAATFDGLLSYRLAAGTLIAGERIALLFERAEHRLTLLADRPAAFQDLKQILKISPNHLASLHKLAEGALEDQDAHGAAQWLVRYLAVAGAGEEAGVAAAQLALATCYEARGEVGRAIETLRLAALARPTDPIPLERMAELQLRGRDGHGAVEALRAAAGRLGDPGARAALALKIGAIERDVARDLPGAAAAFRQAAELDPLGAGAATLVSLHDAASDARGALEVVEWEIANLRRALAGNPLDARRLERLGQWLADARRRGSAGADADSEGAVENVRGLAGGRASPLRAPASVAPKTGRAFLTEIADRAAGGFVAEVWPHLREAAAALFPAPSRPRPAPLGPELAPRVAWISATATALGIARLSILTAREPGAAPAASIDDDAEPSLILAPEWPAWPTFRFHVGRALGLITLHAVVLERVSVADLAPLFACAAVLAGAQVPAGLPKPTESLLRDVTRAVGRKDRKSLTLQASRFGFEPFDLEGWRTATLRAADRFGLFVCGDPAAAAAAIAGGTQAVPSSPAAVALLGFALGDRYPPLRRSVEGGER